MKHVFLFINIPMYSNFCRVHQTLRVTLAMEAGLANHVWTVEELRTLLPKPTVAKSIKDRELLWETLGESA